MNYIILLLILMVSGCATMQSNVTRIDVPVKVAGVVPNVQITNLQNTLTTDGLHVQATISNIANDTPLMMYYRCHFYTNSATKSLIDNSDMWHSLQLYGQQNIDIECSSALPHIHNFVLEINSTKTK